MVVTVGQPARQSYDERQARLVQAQAPCPEMPHRLQAVAHITCDIWHIPLVACHAHVDAHPVCERQAPWECLLESLPVSRLTLLTPSGFRLKKPLATVPVGIVVRPFLHLVRLVWPKPAMPFYIPSATL